MSADLTTLLSKFLEEWYAGTIGSTVAVSRVTATQAGIGTTPTTSVALENPTAATSGATVQMSPRMRWRGTAWDTSASETVDFFAEVLPATGATPTGTWRLGYSLNGGAVTYPLTVTSDGMLNALNHIFTTGNVYTGPSNGNGFIFGSGAWAKFLNAGADALVNLTNNAGTAGFGLDVSTDAVMQIRTRAQTGYATVDALLYKVETATIGVGAGSTAVIGKLAGTGPATAAQNGWMNFVDSAGANVWVPTWK